MQTNRSNNLKRLIGLFLSVLLILSSVIVGIIFNGPPPIRLNHFASVSSVSNAPGLVNNIAGSGGSLSGTGNFLSGDNPLNSLISDPSSTWQ